MRKKICIETRIGKGMGRGRSRRDTGKKASKGDIHRKRAGKEGTGASKEENKKRR